MANLITYNKLVMNSIKLMSSFRKGYKKGECSARKYSCEVDKTSKKIMEKHKST